mmetsp:Transcript_3396/g.10312  ORF Transcript_3396/g.10312 Transcript_3396/m.10312 type:complete len:283 (+) Transcript_3396:228-1076(+)|eukprot:CAMPEP_0198733820 /NCGR_PEP_ID=MMETSP1475-20131203/48471_1 /TAXON_ID= ORGANISM="Unidentified sp., Strain CCMP1999" /NCGR_SAMPLE_ID=MMETSP1475 /ASSEMBLY_ACC=CAM_ASM_001111 /LENGTH=282 /DNA_ID=CAMNT_0044497177 /DNA_START=212 /DNA_END=1060 /DNA_ORIENTATION=-
MSKPHTYKKRRPGALRIPVGGSTSQEEVLTPSQLIDMMSNFGCNLNGAYPPPMSAPVATNNEFEKGFREMFTGATDLSHKMTFDENSADGIELHNDHRGVATSPLTNPFMTPRERTVKVENEISTGLQYSLPNSPRGAAQELSSSRLSSPLSSPRPGADNYKEVAAAKRHRRILLRAMKSKKGNASLSGANLEVLSALLAVKDQGVEEIVDKKTAAAVKNRENAARARQTTKENMQRLKDQNDSLKSEVSDLQNENKNLKVQMEKLTQLLRQTYPGYNGFSP